MLVGIIALIAEVIEYEEIAKVIVIPSLVLLIALSAYTIAKTYLKH
jgi:hypothetical protein